MMMLKNLGTDAGHEKIEEIGLNRQRKREEAIQEAIHIRCGCLSGPGALVKPKL